MLNKLINDYFFSPLSLTIHTLLFAVIWIGLGSLVFTAIISVEAIYLSLFIGIAQKDQHEKLKDHIKRSKK